MLRRLARADALILRAPHAPALPAGAEVQRHSPRSRSEYEAATLRNTKSGYEFLTVAARTYLEHLAQLPVCSSASPNARQ